jgi:AraC-like DNA-binding protein
VTSTTIGLFVSPAWSVAIDRAAAGRTHPRVFDDARELIAGLRAARLDLVLLDPARLTERETVERVRAALRLHGSRCVFCTTLSGDNMRAVVAASSLEPATVLTLDEDGTDERIVQILDDLGSIRTARELWELFGFHTKGLSLQIERVIRDLLAAPEHHFDAEDVARTAGLSRRHLDRILRSAGICSARRLVVAVRVAHAVDRIVRQERSVTATSESLGYASRVVLSRHIKTVVGRVPTELGEGLASPEIREALHRFASAPDSVVLSDAQEDG